MARYEHLPIYRASYSLLLKIMELIRGFPRDFKYTIGENLQKHALDMIVEIYCANSAQDKCGNIRAILKHVQFIGLFLRISMDIRIINETRYAEFVEALASVNKQAAAWLKSCGGREEICLKASSVESYNSACIS